MQLCVDRGLDRFRRLSYTALPGFQGVALCATPSCLWLRVLRTGNFPKLRSVFENRIACGPSSQGRLDGRPKRNISHSDPNNSIRTASGFDPMPRIECQVSIGEFDPGSE